MSTLLALLFLLGSVGYLILSIVSITRARQANQTGNPFLRVVQLILVSGILFISGLILLLQGWRLDPLFLFREVLMLVLMGYWMFVDLRRSLRSNR